MNGFDLIDVFYPYYSAQDEERMKAAFKKAGIEDFDYEVTFSVDGEWVAVYESAGHERDRDSSGDVVLLYRMIKHGRPDF